MDEELEFSVLSDDEVLFISAGRVLMANPTFKVGEFLDALAQLVSEREEDWSDDNEGWFSEGLDCEALRFGNQGWQRGKVRIRLEFCPSKQPRLLQAEGNRRNRENVRDGARENVREMPREGLRENTRENTRENIREMPREGLRENIYAQPNQPYQDDQDDFDSDY
jgi:KGK domain